MPDDDRMPTSDWFEKSLTTTDGNASDWLL